VKPVPDDTTLRRWATLLQPAPLPCLLDHVVALARTLKITRGRTRRLEGTVGETHRHHPTDSTLLSEGVRGLGRPLAKARAVLQKTAGVARTALRDRPRHAQRQMKRLMEAARQRGTEAAARMRTASQRLLAVTQATVPQAHHVGAVRTAPATAQGQQLAATVAHLVPLVCQVIAQTTRRVLQGAIVPAAEKGVSLLAPSTAIIRQGTPGQPTACGRVIWLDEGEGGSSSRDDVLDGHPAEDAQLPPRLEHHRRVFTRPPRLLTGERGVHSAANERYATTHGVKPVVLPTPGATSGKRIADEQQRWCRRGRDWRAGLEGRSSSLKRRHKLDRCCYHGTLAAGDRPGDGGLTHQVGLEDGRRPYLWSKSGET
jgi:IS5 family transposase